MLDTLVLPQMDVLYLLHFNVYYEGMLYMSLKIINKLKNSEIHGNYVGNDNIQLNIALYQDNEREFVVTHNVNIKPVSYFTGRETELEDLRQRIEEGRKSILVSGMGGIGKTNICKKLFEEYLNRHAVDENDPFQHIGYIEYTGDMDSSLQSCLKFKLQNDSEQNQEAAWRELEYLAADGKLLLFIDNVNVSVEEDKGLERLKAIPGAIVVTSRRTSFCKEFEPYRIGFLSTEQCKVIYERIRYRDSSKKVSEEDERDLIYIIEKIAARHTITIEFLASLAKNNYWTVKRMRKELEKKGFCLKFHKDGEIINIQESYETLYDVSKLMEAEQNVLEAFSIFPYIPLEAEICNQWLLADAGVSEDDDILMGLYEKGWLQFNVEQEKYAMHPVFAQFIYERYKPKMERHCRLIEGCQRFLEISKSGSVIECQKYIAFGKNIIDKLDILKNRKKTDFIYTLAVLLDYTGQYRETEKLFYSLCEIHREKWGEYHLNTAVSYNDLAILYKKNDEYEKAKSLFEKCITIQERAFGENYPNIANGYYNLATVYQLQGEYEKAKELYEKAEKLYEKNLRMLKKTYGKKHLNTAEGYCDLAQVYEKQHEYKKSIKMYEKSIGILERVLGDSHPDIVTIYKDLAGVYRKQKEYEKAEELYKKSIMISKTIFGESHPDTVEIYSHLAYTYSLQGKYREAEELYKKILQIQERVLGKNHPDKAISYLHLAFLYMSQMKLSEAEKLYNKGLQIQERVFGENHPCMSTFYNNKGSVNLLQGNYREAEELYKKSLQINEQIRRENHPFVLLNYHNLAQVYAFQGKYREMKEMINKEIQIRFENGDWKDRLEG